MRGKPAHRRITHRASVTMSSTMIPLQPQHGYVFLTAFASVLVHHFYMAFGVGMARKK